MPASKPSESRTGPAPAGSHYLVESFLEMLAVERGAAPNTVQAYARDLTDYLCFLQNRCTVPPDVDAETVRAYLRDLSALGLAPSTAARKLKGETASSSVHTSRAGPRRNRNEPPAH